jgi:hypothetical protein
MPEAKLKIGATLYVKFVPPWTNTLLATPLGGIDMVMK